MSSASRLALPAWLAWRGLRAHLGETALRVGVSVVAVVLLVVGCALGPTALVRSARSADAIVPLSQQPAAGEVVRAAVEEDYAAGTPITLVSVAVPATAETAWRDLRLPRPGELVVSPALRAVLADPTVDDAAALGAVLRGRYPGRVVGEVPEARLLGPHALVVWRGVDVADLPADAGWLTDTAKRADDVASALPDELSYGYPLLVLGFLLPLFALIALLASLGGVRREQRLAALRLVGLTDRSAKLAAALEDGLLSAGSALIGVALALLVVPRLAPFAPVRAGVWPADVTVDWRVGVPLLVLFPVVSLLASLAGLRLLATSPLGVERRSVARPVRRWRLVPLTLGAILLAGVLAGLAGPAEVRAPVLIGTTALLMAGLATSLPFVVRAVATRGVVTSRSLPGLLAARRTLGDPGRASRVAVSLTLMVAVSGPLLVFFPLIADLATPDLDRMAARVGATTLTVTRGPGVPGAGADPWDRVGSAPEVAAAVQLHVLTLGIAGSPDSQPRVLVADCDRLAAVTDVPASQCERGLASPTLGSGVAGATARVAEEVVRPDGTQTIRLSGVPFALPSRPVRSATLEALDAAGSTGAVLLVSARAVPRGAVSEALAVTALVAPRSGQIEQARTRILRETGSTALTVGERHQIAGRSTHDFQVLALLAATLIVLICGFATTVTAYEQVRSTLPERRLLAVGGTPRRVLDAALVLQVAFPAVLGVAAGAVVSLLLALGYVGLIPYTEIAVPVGGVLAVALVGLLAPLTATAAVARLTPSATVAGEQP